ncbi:MAG: 4Fe-4S binding protein [Thermoleophilia bacterium]|nr:4Fe-4S binding protein [Thermoleophilia bacterium]
MPPRTSAQVKTEQAMPVIEPIAGGNLLALRPVAAVMRSRLYPGVFQWATAAVFVLVVYQLLIGPDLASENFGTALTWVIWWPLLPILFLLVGRFWCAICPFGTLSDAVQRLTGAKRRVPRFLKNYGIWLIDATFILITWADHVFGVVESPWGSGVLLLMVTTAVIVSGALFQRRAFCRYLCFLGGVAGNYSRAGMVSLRGTPAICETCKDRAACFNGTERAPACPMFEFPRKMDSSANCNLCGNCVKNCPNDAIQLTVRPPTKELWFVRSPKLAESFLAVVIMGIVLVQNVTMLDTWNGMLTWLQGALGTSSYAVIFTVAFVAAIAVPMALLSLAAAVAGRFNGETAILNFTRFGYALIPLDIAGHVAHNLFHLLAEGKAVVYTSTALVGAEDNGASAAIVSTGKIQVLQYTLLALGMLASLYTAYRIARSRFSVGSARRTLAPYAAIIVALAILNFGLFALPMAMRM